MNLVLIEIAEDHVKDLNIPFVALGVYENHKTAEMQALYKERAAMIKVLGEINAKIVSKWIGADG